MITAETAGSLTCIYLNEWYQVGDAAVAELTDEELNDLIIRLQQIQQEQDYASGRATPPDATFSHTVDRDY